jgi:hypothetical protein
MFSRILLMLCAVLLARSPLAEDAAGGDFVRLVDALDEPEFYCLDLAGWGRNLQLDDPLQTHTCKNRGADDQKFHFADGQLKVSLYDRCVQAAGSSGTTLAGAAVLARPCTDNPLQMLSLDDDGLLRVGDTGYCLAAGTDSREASGPSHMWRTLVTADCDSATASLATWQVGL